MFALARLPITTSLAMDTLPERLSLAPHKYIQRSVFGGIEHSRLHSENKTSPDERHFYDDSSLLPVPGKIPDAPLIISHAHAPLLNPQHLVALTTSYILISLCTHCRMCS
jgi:hypothetical protein